MSVVEEIKQRLDVVEVISAYVPLRKAGRHFKGLCPFHQERTPSFVVFPESGTWHCFGACGTGGDIFGFIMKREGVDFHEALEILARKAGVDLAPPTPAQSEHERYLDRLREINHAAALYFHHQLRHAPPAQVGRDYLQRRGLDDAIVESFLIGYAPQEWTALLDHLRSKNYAVEDMLAAGLIVEKEHEDARVTYYDRFRGRVVVPIRDLQGRIIGFGGRVLDQAQQPKYLNTPQTPLFDKSSVLFGLDAAHKAIRARGQAIIVEGYMDVLAAHQFGETNVVASMGTALTERQLKQLKRFTDTFILALDADTAGQAATLRGIAQVREALDREWVPTITATGLLRREARLAANLRIMTLPEGQDPDEVIRSDVGVWQGLVRSAQPVVDYFFALVRRELDLTTAQGKSEAVERLAPLIHEVGDEVQRAHYTQQLARLIGLDERTAERLVAKKRPAPSRVVPPPPEAEAAEPVAETVQPTAQRAGRRSVTPAPVEPGAATHCLALLVSHPDLLPSLQAELGQIGTAPLDEDDFGRAEERAICSALLAGQITPDGAWPAAPVELQQLLAQIHNYGRRGPSLSQRQLQQDAVNAVLRLRIEALKARSRQLPALVHQAEAEGQDEEAQAYRRVQRDLSRHRLALEQALNARTLTGRRQAVTR